jgi:DNA-binding transcriptional LysR family regulator
MLSIYISNLKFLSLFSKSSKFSIFAAQEDFTMDVWHLKIFQQVVKLKSFSHAAKAVNLTQPTVSTHIKELETHFGCRLLDRLGRQALPTRAGELLFDHAGKILAQFQETETAMAGFLGKISGRLTIGGSTIPGGYILPRIIGRFLNRHQNVHISLIVGDTEQIIEDILSSRIEIGIVGARIETGRIIQTRLIEDDMRLIVPANHKWAGKKRVSLNMMLMEPFIMRESGSGTRKTLQHRFAEMGIDTSQLNIMAEMGSTAAVIQGIKNNIGIAILSPIAVAEELAAGTLKALTVNGMRLKRHFYLTVHQDRTASPLCAAFTDFLRQSSSAG